MRYSLQRQCLQGHRKVYPKNSRLVMSCVSFALNTNILSFASVGVFQWGTEVFH